MHASAHKGARPSQIQVGTFDSAVEHVQACMQVLTTAPAPPQIQVGTFDSAVELEQLALKTPPEALFIDEEVRSRFNLP